MTSENRIITVQIPIELADKIDLLAVQLKQSPDWVMAQALSAWVEQDERHRMTLEALADVDAGRVVDHEAVRAWTKSLGTSNPLPVPKPK